MQMVDKQDHKYWYDFVCQGCGSEGRIGVPIEHHGFDMLARPRWQKYLGINESEAQRCPFYAGPLPRWCVHNTSPRGEFGDWCWSTDAARDAEGRSDE
jgi:hypothetical protein